MKFSHVLGATSQCSSMLMSPRLVRSWTYPFFPFGGFLFTTSSTRSFTVALPITVDVNDVDPAPVVRIELVL